MIIPDFLTSSGNVLLDRRFEYARSLVAAGEISSAIDLLEQSYDMAADWPVLSYYLGDLYVQMGAYDKAAEYLNRSLCLDPEDHQGARLKLQQCTNINAPELTLPPAFVKTLFDQYAPRFESHLLDTLNYKVPQIIYNILQTERPHFTPRRILDLGCGTGLAAAYFSNNADWIVGVDISPGMLSQAAQKNIYNELLEQDLSDFLTAPATQAGDKFDLIIAADVFTYFGELDYIFNAISHLMTQNALFAFSVQTQQQDADPTNSPYFLQDTNRFIHDPGYIDQQLTASNFTALAREPHVLRQDRGKDVDGLIYVCE